MATQLDHNKIIKKIANERLKPFGIFQKGQSRTFLYDKGWFTIVIEFQPSSWSKGTYLNVGVDFNFYPRDYFAFAYGSRETKFEAFRDEEQFNIVVNKLCDLTIKRVQELDQKCKDIWTALQTIDNKAKDDTWRLYEVAFLNALASNFDKAQMHFRKVSTEKCGSDWEIERKRVAEELLHYLQNIPTYLEHFKSLINKTRQLKKLPAMSLDNLLERKITPNNLQPSVWWRVWLDKLSG